MQHSKGSISQWLDALKDGDAEAAQPLWERYFPKLVDLARQRLQGSPRRMADEEDVALSAFASFCRATERGRFPDLTDRDGLWRLLMTITARKAIDQQRYDARKVRGGDVVVGESALVGPEAAQSQQPLTQIIGDEPTPELAAIAADQLQQLMDVLDDDLREVALAKLEGSTNREIAVELDCSLSTVERSLRLIRKKWQREALA